MKLQPMGEAALVVETEDAAQAQALRRTLLDLAIPGVRDLVPGQSSLLVSADPLSLDLDALAARLEEVHAGAWAPKPCEHEVLTDYSGEDLATVAKLAG